MIAASQCLLFSTLRNFHSVNFFCDQSLTRVIIVDDGVYYMCKRVCLSVCTHVCMCACVSAYIYTYICICISLTLNFLSLTQTVNPRLALNLTKALTKIDRGDLTCVVSVVRFGPGNVSRRVSGAKRGEHCRCLCAATVLHALSSARCSPGLE